MSRFIRLRGLPWSVTHKEILDFLKNVTVVNGPKGILMVTSRWDGKNTGEAFVELENEKDEQEAFKQNRAVLGHRYIEIFSASNEEVQCAMKKPGSAFSTVVKLRGLPYAVTEEQIEKFFHGLDIKPDREGILIVMDRRGRATGEAYVQFETQDDTEKALGRNREKIGHRYIEIFRSSTAELRRQLLGNRVGPYDLKERGAARNRNDLDIPRNITRARDSRGFGFHNNNNQLDYNSGKSFMETGFGFRNDFPFMTSNNNNSFGSGNTNFGQKNNCGFQENTFPFTSSDFFNMSNSDATNLSKAIGFSNSNLNYGAADNNSNRNYTGFTNEFSLFKNFRNNRKANNTDNFCRENSAINSIFGDSCFNMTNADNVENTANNDVFGVTGKIKHKPDGRYGSNDGRRQDDFFCVHMRGLPYNSFENDVFKFFDPIRPANVKIVFNNKGLHSGTADAIFETYEDAQLAMKRHMEQIGSRYIELFFDGKAKLNGYSRRI